MDGKLFHAKVLFMADLQRQQISRKASVFQGRALPEQASLAGYAALIDAYELRVPLPEQLAAVSPSHRRYVEDDWAIFTPRHMPEDTVAGISHLRCATKGVDPGVLHALFVHIGGDEISAWVRREPVGRYSRRAWFFYEWLMDQRLALPDATTGNFVAALDPAHYCVGSSIPSRRHHVHDNLPGVRDFCPPIRRTTKIEQYLARDWSALAYEKIGLVHPTSWRGRQPSCCCRTPAPPSHWKEKIPRESAPSAGGRRSGRRDCIP